MKNKWILFVCLFGAALSTLEAKPRFPFPSTPDEIGQNDRDLDDDIQSVKETLDDVATATTTLLSGSTHYIFNGSTAQSATFNVSSGTVTNFFSNTSTITSASIGTLTVTGTATFSGGVASLFAYRRPTLTFVSTTTIDVENNTGTANETTLMFGDGTMRSVTENTGTTDKYRRLITSANAQFTSGTEDSGLRSGMTAATNTTYAIYGVKSLISSSNFVLVADTFTPTQANFSSLNTFYGTNGWVYLGYMRRGDNSGATAAVLDFEQDGNTTLFKNTAAPPQASLDVEGYVLASNASSTGVAYTYSAGTTSTDIPPTAGLCLYGMQLNTGGTNTRLSNSGNTRTYINISGISGNYVNRSWMACSEGARSGVGSATPNEVWLFGFKDNALGVGSNPVR